MPRRRAVLLGLGVAALACAPAHANAPLRFAPSEEQRRLAVQLMEALGAATLHDRTMPELRQRVIALFQRHGMDAARAAAAADELIMPEFRAQRGELITAMSRPLSARFSAEELREILRAVETPIMRRHIEAELGGKPLGVFERMELSRVRANAAPPLRRLAEEAKAIQAEMERIGSEVGTRIAEQALRKHDAALRHRGLRS
jgi:hypothetical protein